MEIKQTRIVPSGAQTEAITTIVDVNGTLDGRGVQSLLESVQALMERGSRQMVFNLTEVDSVTSAGVVGLYVIGELLEGRAVQHLSGWHIIGRMRTSLAQAEMFSNLCLASPNQSVNDQLRTSSFDRLVRMLPTVDDALAALPAG